MKKVYFVANMIVALFAESLFGQTNQVERLFIPGLDQESQSNVVVKVSDLYGDGEICPPQYTNVLSNTNLFTLAEQLTIKGVFEKYRNVTTNVGPLGTELASLYKTNFVIKARNKVVNIENWVARFRYTNSDSYEEITIGRSLSAKFRTKLNDGYNVYFNRTGDGTLLNFGEVKRGLTSGLLASFNDIHAQGITWSYKLANFSDNSLVEYRQYTNGMVFGKFLMWNPQNGNLIVKAEFQEPYDWKKNLRQIQ